MLLLKSYNHLKGYLERWTLFKFGRLHVRFHVIKRNDATPFLHNHPFSFISIILRGGYIELLEDRKVDRKLFSFAFRRSSDFHRIQELKSETLTLFIAWSSKDYEWQLKKGSETCKEWVEYEKGVYLRNLNGSWKYSKFDDYWFVACECLEDALNAVKPSINQTSKPESKVLSIL